jgi:hypothetical protein
LDGKSYRSAAQRLQEEVLAMPPPRAVRPGARRAGRLALMKTPGTGAGRLNCQRTVFWASGLAHRASAARSKSGGGADVTTGSLDKLGSWHLSSSTWTRSRSQSPTSTPAWPSIVVCLATSSFGATKPWARPALGHRGRRPRSCSACGRVTSRTRRSPRPTRPPRCSAPMVGASWSSPSTCRSVAWLLWMTPLVTVSYCWTRPGEPTTRTRPVPS